MSWLHLFSESWHCFTINIPITHMQMNGIRIVFFTNSWLRVPGPISMVGLAKESSAPSPLRWGYWLRFCAPSLRWDGKGKFCSPITMVGSLVKIMRPITMVGLAKDSDFPSLRWDYRLRLCFPSLWWDCQRIPISSSLRWDFRLRLCLPSLWWD